MVKRPIIRTLATNELILQTNVEHKLIGAQDHCFMLKIKQCNLLPSQSVIKLIAPHPQLCRPHLVHPSVLNPSGHTWGDPEQSSEDRDRLPSKGRGVPPQSREWGPPPEGALRTVLSAVLRQRLPTHATQSSNRHLPSRPPPPQGHLLRWPCLLRRLLRGRMIEKIVRSQGPNQVLMATLPPTDPACTGLLLRSYRSALSHLRSGYCSRLQSYRHSVGWADGLTCPDCRSTDHTVAHLFSCPSQPTDLAPGDMWVAPLQVPSTIPDRVPSA